MNGLPPFPRSGRGIEVSPFEGCLGRVNFAPVSATVGGSGLAQDLGGLDLQLSGLILAHDVSPSLLSLLIAESVPF